MKIRQSAGIAALTAAGLLSSPALAQLPGGVTNAASAAAGAANTARAQAQAQARVQERVQTQVQQRVQSQVQAQVQSRLQAQVQARAQSEAGRVVALARRAVANVSAQVDRARQESSAGVRAGVDLSTRANVRAGGNDAALAADARVDGQAQMHASLPAESNAAFTAADQAAVDAVFGAENPFTSVKSGFWGHLAHAAQAETPAAGNSPNNSRDPQAGQPAPNAAGGGFAQLPSADVAVDVGARVNAAIRHRLSEISQLRDHAVAQGDVDLLARADQMESRLSAFVEAQRAARSGAEAVSQARPNGKVPPAMAGAVSGQANGAANAAGAATVPGYPRTAELPPSAANANANAAAAAQTQVQTFAPAASNDGTSPDASQ